jgi:phage terminase large subunit-like protein
MSVPRIDNIDQAILEPTLLGAAFGGDIISWQTWRTTLKATWGIELNRDEARSFASIAGSRKPPAQRVRKLWCIIGRRGGKSRIAALIVCYVALFVKHKLAPGERGLRLILSATVEQSKVALSYCQAFLESSPVLRQEIEDVTANETRLKNGIVVATHPNSFRSIRGRTCAAIGLLLARYRRAKCLLSGASMRSILHRP